MKWWWLALPAGAALAARLLTGPHPIDDAYITFRYARNLGEGLGLVYNSGDWVLGTTAPLWAVILGLAYRLGAVDVPLVATALSAVCDAVSAGLLALLSLRAGLSPRGAAAVGLVWAINPMSITFAVGGMETSLFVLALLLALTLAARGGRWLLVAAPVAGLSALVRPEGLLLGGVVVGWTWLVARRRAPWALAGVAAPVLAGGLLLLARYGSPLPNSIAAKQVAYVPPAPFENILALLLQAGLPGWSTFVPGFGPAALGVVLAALGTTTLVVLMRKGIRGRDLSAQPWQPFAGFALLYLVFFVVVGVRGVRLFPWYLVPIEPLYLLGAAAGLAQLGWLGRAWLPALLLAWQAPAIDWRQPLLAAGYHQEREAALFEIGRGLAETLPPNAVVAAPEIGALGYASNLRILDTVGLVSPAALPYYPLPADELVVDNAIPARLIHDKQPDMVVTLDAFAQRSLLNDPTFQRDYRLEHAYPVQVWQSSKVLLFRRVSPP